MLSKNVNITDTGGSHLIRAMWAGQLPNLEFLLLGGTGISANCAQALTSAVLQHCPKIRCINFPDTIDEAARKIIRGKGNHSISPLMKETFETAQEGGSGRGGTDTNMGEDIFLINNQSGLISRLKLLFLSLNCFYFSSIPHLYQ